MEISVSKLTRLWIAEQFVKARVDKRLEVVAEEYLEELVDRSLILVGRRGANRRIKTCKIHDVIRQLFTRQAQIENVVHFMDGTITDFSQGLYDQQRVVLQLNDFSRCDYFLEHGSDGITSTIRSLIFTKACCFYFSEFPCSTVSHFKLLKVLDVSAIRNDFSRVIPQLVHLRYIAAGIDDPASLAKLRNLQTIILVAYEVQLPLEIWKMSAIRHIDVGWSNHIPNPLEAENHSSIGEEKLLFLNNLQNLALPSCPFLDEILTRTPNLNKLKIRVVSNTDWSVFVRCPILLQGLETLHILSAVEHDPIILSRHVFMSNIKQLTLVYTFFPWEDTVVLANLSKLEVLKANGGFWGTDWRLNADVVFPKLKYLRLEYGDLERWEETSSDNFPVLEQLVLIWFNSLEEIPQAIGDIATLILIQVEKCGPVVEASAEKIHEEQESLGNYGLQIRTHRS
ncbi:putative homeobox-leucine zipper protein HOX3-like [Capsicum annuum]|nr:putative homeobox-leucine zipper protein HOX3-like [Capsicum annuum]